MKSDALFRRMAMMVGAVVLVTLAGCSGAAKKEAALALESASLAYADALAVRTDVRAPMVTKEAETALSEARSLFENKEFERAKARAAEAVALAKKAVTRADYNDAKKAQASKASQSKEAPKKK